MLKPPPILVKSWPKKRHQIVFDATPTFDDQVRSLAPMFVEAGFDVLVLDFWEEAQRPRWLPSSVVVLPKRSLAGVRALLQSGAVLHTHGSFFEPRDATGQIGLNLWHGMPLKKIGALGDIPVKRSGWTLSTSIKFQSIMAEALAMPTERVLNFGLPRNDVLSNPSDDDEAMAELLSGPNGFVMYLPTYRRSVKGDIRIDGSLVVEESVAVDIFVDQLASLGFTLVVKPHPMADPVDLDIYRGRNGVHVLAESDLTKAHSSLYGLLGLSAALVTDYSSVAVDFLVTGKPIAFYTPDEGRYAATRGFVFEPRELTLLGPKFTSLDDLSAALGDILASKAITEVPNLFYDAPTTGAAQRTFEFVTDELANRV